MNNDVSRIKLILESPAPLTSAMPGKDRISLLMPAWCSKSADTTISKSPIVERLLLADPARVALFTFSISDTFASNAKPYINPISSLLLERNLANNSIPSRIFC